MKLEAFLEKFDLFADAPSAVAKMREMVLQLAVTGKLVPQETRDKPASLLIKSVEAERGKLIAAKKIKSRPTSPVAADEQPFDLPSKWVWGRLSDVGHELGQKVPNKRITYIDVGGIDSDKGCISHRVQQLEPGDAPSRARKIVARGTVIYSTVRPYLLNISIVDQDFDPEPIASTAFGILHPFEGINNRYLFYWLRSAPFTAYVQASMKGMAYPAINDEKFYSGFIAIPPVAEQKRIVAKVDELISLCDRLEAQQQERETRHIALARASLARFAEAPSAASLSFIFNPIYDIPPADLRKSILTLAVQGKLVAQDPNDKPAADGLRLLEAKGRASKTRRSVPSDVTMPSTLDKENLPESWVIESTARLLQIGAITDLKDGNHGANHPKVAEFTEAGLPFITAAQVSDDGRIDYDSAYKVSGKVLQRLRVGFAKPDDVIYTHKGSVGRVAICDRECVLTPQTTYYRLNSGVLGSGFVRIVLRSPFFQHQVDLVKRQTTRDFVSINAQYQFFLRVPPIAEQHRIVARVDKLMALVDELEGRLTESRAVAANLLSALGAELTAAP
jgi:type I restriction enzyme S subunit